MHEMSIALNILDIVEQSAQQHSASKVTDISIEVGALAGVLISSLEFCLETAKQHTLARSAHIQIHEIGGQGHCPECGGTFPMELPIMPCPHCANGYLRPITGDELRIKAIEIERVN
jgi:hydrogenase nickel incorporation protein HypA/HybF